MMSFLSFYSAITNAENLQNQADRIVHIYYFHDIAILDVVTDSTPGQIGRVAKKIIIRKLIQPDNAAMKKSLLTTLAPPKPKLGEVIWTITPDTLPVTSDTCIKAGIDDCDYDPNNHSAFSGCYHSCVLFGPEYLTYDEKSKKLYFLADTTEVGQATGPFLGFVADIDKQDIKYLKVFNGFSKGEVSPTGKYLLLKGNSFITVYNTESGDESQVVSQQLHYMYKVHWLNDTQFSYQDGARHSKFQTSFDGVEENIYDIPSRKILRKRTLSRSEYINSQYIEPN